MAPPPPGTVPLEAPPPARRYLGLRPPVLVGVAVLLLVALIAASLTLDDDAGPTDPVEDTTASEERPATTLAEEWSVDAQADLVGVTMTDDLVITLDAVGTVAGFGRGDGAPRWTRPLGGEGLAGPQLVDGVAVVQIRVSTGESLVAAVDPASGEERWRASGGPAVSDTLGAGDGVVVLPTESGEDAFRDVPGRLLAAADGSTLVDLAPGEELGQEVADPPMLTDDLVIMSVGDGGGERLVAYRRDDGRVAWEANHPGARMTRLVAGMLLRGVETYPESDAGGEITTEYQALDPATGDELWTRTVDGAMANPPVAAGDLVVLNHTGGGGDGLVGIEADSGDEQWTINPLPLAEVAIVDDLLLVAELGLRVYDLGDRSELASIDLPQGLRVMTTADDLAVIGSGRTLGAYSITQERSLQEAWQFSDSALSGTGVAAGDVIVAGNAEREVVAVDRSSGEERWRSEAFDDVDASGSRLQPTVAGDLVLVADGDDDTEVVALSVDDGAERWRVPVDRADNRVDAELAGDVLVLGVDPVQGVDPATGRVLWRDGGGLLLETRGGISAMALDSDGTTVVTTGTSELAAFDAATGAVRWRTNLPLELFTEDATVLDGVSGIAVAGERVIVALTTGGSTIDRLQARAMSDGSQVWEADVPGGAGSFAVGEGIAATVQDDQLVARDLATGETRWEAAGRDGTARVAVGDGVVAAWATRLFLVDAATGETLDEVSTGLPPLMGTPLLTGDLVVIQSEDEETLVAHRY
jgi:outer membrane protein assembly factor BamB